jgi:CRP-like cAMP-binding protein
MSDAGIDFSLLTGNGAETRTFKAGEVIFREGDPAGELFVVVTGRVDIKRGDRTIETVPENVIFGEMALVDDEPRSASAVAATESTIVPVSEQQFLFMVRHTPFFALNVMRTLARRLRAANELAD